MSEKDELRQKMRIKRKYFQYVRRETSDRMIASTFENEYMKYETFLLYVSKGDEASTEIIINRILNEGKTVLLPRVEGKDIVTVPYGKLKKGAFGVPEPEGQAYNGDIDVVIVPLLAVNERGYRLGYGGGYYDRFLKDCNAIKVGLGYFFQIENFAEDEWDIPLEYFLCERGIYNFGKIDD